MLRLSEVLQKTNPESTFQQTSLYSFIVCVCVCVWGGGGGGGDDALQPKGGGGVWGKSIATGLGREPVGGCCYSAEMRRPAIRSTAHDPILSYPTYQPPIQDVSLQISVPNCVPLRGYTTIMASNVRSYSTTFCPMYPISTPINQSLCLTHWSNGCDL